MWKINMYDYWLLNCIEIKIHACTPSIKINHTEVVVENKTQMNQSKCETKLERDLWPKEITKE